MIWRAWICCLAIAAPASAQCVAGLSTIPCDLPAVRVVDVQPGGLQAALTNAQPGDHLRLRAGVHSGGLNATVHGTAARPIVVTRYPGESPVVSFTPTAESQSLWLRGRYYIVDGLTITGGWHCVAVDAQYILLRGNTFTACGKTGGQGVLVLHSDVALLGNTVQDVGLSWLSHAVYVSDFYGRNIKRVSLLGNTLTDTTGAGVQVWNASRRVTDVLVRGNAFARHAVDVILTNVDRATLEQNTVAHDPGPATNAPVSAWLWFEGSTVVRITRNTFAAAVSSPACVLVTGVNQSLAQLWWSSNTWTMPGCAAYTDAALNQAGGH